MNCGETGHSLRQLTLALGSVARTTPTQSSTGSVNCRTSATKMSNGCASNLKASEFPFCKDFVKRLPIMTYIRFLWFLMRHKWFVFVAGRKLNVPIGQLFAHDLNKLSPSFITVYAKHCEFKRLNKNGSDRSDEWHDAVQRHQNSSPHHHQYWKRKDIPDCYLREMAADLMGASRNYIGHWPKDFKHWNWWRKYGDTMKISKEDHNKLFAYILNIMYSK